MKSCQCNPLPPVFSYFARAQEKDESFSDDLYAVDNISHCEAWGQVTSSDHAKASSTYDRQPEYEDDMQFETTARSPSTEKKSKQSERFFSHAHRHKAPQLVAKRNMRERNRVQAVNGAFNRLRKAVPIQHARGKRISKVKTLQNAINYIKGLEHILRNEFFQTISMR